jgi:hypothetical protein
VAASREDESMIILTKKITGKRFEEPNEESCGNPKACLHLLLL